MGNQGQIIEQAKGIIADNDGEFIPSLTISNATVTDGNNAAKANFVVRLDRPYNTPITVDYRTKDGLAIAGKDYITQNGTLTFESGETQKTIEVDILGDLLSDRDQDFKIRLSNVSSNAKLTDNIGVGNIINPTLNIALANGGSTNLEIASYPPNGTKDPNNLAFAVTANHNNLSITGNGNGWKEIPLGESISNGQKPLNPYSVIQFDFRSSSEGKLHGIHFEGTDHHAFYAPWEKGRFFQLYGSGEFGIQDFNNYENIGQWKTYQIPVHQYFDTNNWRNFGQWVVFAHEGDSEDSNTRFRNLQIKELLPISVNQVALTEDVGVANFTLTIPEASTETITVDYATADDTAIAGMDYIATSGTVIFNPGETSKTIDVAINDDSLSEENEIFNLNLSNAAKAILIDQTTTATIADNDIPLPIISVSDLSLNEGNANKTATVTVSLDKSGTEAITVNYKTLDNTAVSELDYQAVEGKITFNPGQTTKTIKIPIIGDLLNEADESFYFQIKDAVNAKINNTQAEATLGNDDPLPQIEIKDAAVLSSIPVRDSNGNIKNTTGLLFEITLNAPSNQTITVNYETADGTATAGEDYSARRKPLTFKPGETVKQVFVGVTLDDTTEADETLYLNLSQPVNALIKDEQAVGIIEETKSLSVSDLTVSEDGTEALFTVSLDQSSVQGVFVDYATADGTARAGSDYTETKGRLFIKAGEAKATIAVPLLNNKLTEADETFFLNLTKPKYVLIDDSQGQATITNDDPLLAENPGGIYQNLQLWLKADGNLNTNNGQIITWSDNSQLELDLEQNTVDSQPTLISNGLNYNPVLKFDGDDLLETINTLPADFAADSSVFVVTKHNAHSYNFLFTLDDTGWGRFLAHMPWGGNIHFDAGGTGNGRLSIPYADSAAKEFNTWHFSSETGVGQNIFRNGLSLAADNNTRTPITQDRRFQIGRQYDGEIAEVIVFNQALSTGDRLAVDSYLGIKYGFTIDQTTPTNYVNSEGEVIWDAATAGNYNYDVAGIALDLASGLNQPKSRSSNQDAIVTIEAEDKVNGLEDGEALVWSNQGNLSNRVWQVQENQGDVGKVSLSFDLSQLGQQLPLADYALQISSQDNFDNSQFHTTGRTITDNTLTFTGVDFDHGDYFTLDTSYSDRVAYPAGNRLQPQPMGEVGIISELNHKTQTIQLNHSYNNPVVLAMPLSYNGIAPAIARITEIQHDSFTVYAQEAEYKDGKHAPESLSYMVLEAGTWELPDGTLLEAGTVDTNSTTNSLWSEIDFASNFLTKPAVFSQVQTQNGEQFVRTRQQSNNAEGFQLAMEEEELLKPSGHATETIGWLAMETGTGDWGDLKYQAGHTGLRIDHTWDQIKFKQDFENAPNIFASLASFQGGDSAGLRYQNLDSSQVQIKVEEDQSADSEIAHAKEIVDFLAISGSGDLTALAHDADFI
ncbi:MAG: Calx-beta domain-containing protein [Cyanobacteria bacterium J06642_3]